MKARLRSAVIAAALLAVASVMGVGASTASATGEPCILINGAGSSLQKEAQQSVWIPNWTPTGPNLCETKPTIHYNVTSSGKGKEQWGDKGGKLKEFEKSELLPAFIGTDTAASVGQMEKMNTAGGQASLEEGVMAVPVAQSAITVAISLPEGCEPETGEANVKAEVLQGPLIQEWEENNVNYLSLLKDKILGSTCDEVPALLARSSNSGTSAGVKHYFLKLANALGLEKAKIEKWKAVAETLTEAEEPIWPEPANAKVHKCCSSGAELVTDVYLTSGRVGYADLGDSAATGKFKPKWEKHMDSGKTIWTAIGLVEAGGAMKTPEATSKASACENAKYAGEGTKAVKGGEDWSTAQQENINSSTSYPICTLTYDLTWHNYLTTVLTGAEGYGSLANAEKTRNTVKCYLHWILQSPSSGNTEGGQSTALQEAHYGLLPATIKEHAILGVLMNIL